MRNCSADVARPCCLVAPLGTDLGRATDLSEPALTRPGPARALWRKINCRLPSGLYHDEASLPAWGPGVSPSASATGSGGVASESAGGKGHLKGGPGRRWEDAKAPGQRQGPKVPP